MLKESLKKYSNIDRCPIRHILDKLGDKWSLLVVSILHEADTLRFNEMYKYIGEISQKMLAVTLKNLEKDSLVIRKAYPEIPPRVEYSLSERGKSLIPHIEGLMQWAEKNFEAITSSRLEAEVQK